MEITFEVIGTPQPQGSARAFIPKGWNRPVITSTNKNLKPWRQEVAAVAAQAMQQSGAQMFVKEPVHIDATFFFDKPKSVRTLHKITKPDLDKLVRALGDALTGVVYKDDSQIVTAHISKFFGTPSRVVVTVGNYPFVPKKE